MAALACFSFLGGSGHGAQGVAWGSGRSCGFKILGVPRKLGSGAGGSETCANQPAPTLPSTPASVQASSMGALQALRAALHALCDPSHGLVKGVAMAPLAPEALQGAVKAAASALTSPSFTSLSAPGGAKGSGAPGSPAAALVAACAEGVPPPTAAPGVQAFKKAGCAAVWVDPTGLCNLAAHMSKASVAHVAAAARATLAILESPRDAEEALHAALLTPWPAAAAWDYVWGVPVRSISAAATGAAAAPSAHAAASAGKKAGKAAAAALAAGEEGEDGSGEVVGGGLVKDACAWR